MEGTPKAITIQGIVRNQTKIGVQDGQCEDLINLRFKDGSWRTAGKGKLVHVMTGTTYEQLYIHANVYHHVLGVRNGALYWFANLDSDGETFTELPQPVFLVWVSGDVFIQQNGHLITIVDSADSFEYAVFKTGDNNYRIVQTQQKDKPSNREMFPYGMVHFNLSRNLKEDGITIETERRSDNNDFYDGIFDLNDSKLNITKEWFRNKGKSIYGKHTQNNRFTRPFLVVAAIKLYDGSYLYASPPTYIYPNEATNSYDETYFFGHKTLSGTIGGNVYNTNGYSTGDTEPSFDGGSMTKVKAHQYNHYQCIPISGSRTALGKELPCYWVFVGGENTDNPQYTDWANAGYSRVCKVYKADSPCTFAAGAHIGRNKSFNYAVSVMSFDLVMSLYNTNILKDNEDIFKSLCIFVTPEVDNIRFEDGDSIGSLWVSSNDAYMYYRPNVRTSAEIANDLMRQPFYLLKEYNANSLRELMENPIVDLTKAEDENLLANLTQQPMLDTEAFKSGESYLPKVCYNYNGRLHIANYRKRLFAGYPLDMIQLNNHILEYSYSSYYEHILPHLQLSSLDKYMQFSKSKYPFFKVVQQPHDLGDDTDFLQEFIDRNAYFVLIKVYLSDNTEVHRVIKAYQSDSQHDGEFPNFIEDLPPLLTYPDSRAYKMEIVVMQPEFNGQDMFESCINISSDTFELKPALYMDMAYYINVEDNLQPNRIHNFNGTNMSYRDFIEKDPGTDYGIFMNMLEKESSRNDVEYVPHGLKVSKINNPFFFPVESTYQIGASEIVALMSNAIAVGTGQTGSAPLYVFCKDGVYALFVDSSGEMTYTNSRIIARDVCNNAKSVTPIDSGVVFTTDRGIMCIAGNTVQEIGQNTEGDVFDITDTADKAKKIMYNAFSLKKIADLPVSLLDNVDFLTFLKGSIINYNHNERELMVSNNEKDENGNRKYEYTYILDREGQWSRRDVAADEYLDNYPTSYRVQGGMFYKIDEELGGIDMSDNRTFLLSQVIKLDSIGFKETHRVVVRGYFETDAYYPIAGGTKTVINKSNAFFDAGTLFSVSGKINLFRTGDNIKAIDGDTLELRLKNLSGMPITIALGCKKGENEDTYMKDFWVGNDSSDVCAQGEEKSTEFKLARLAYTTTRVYFSVYSGAADTNLSTETKIEYSLRKKQSSHIGLYVFGSYDGRQWALIGGNEKSGKFTDIGCKVAHTDIRFLRVCLAGQLSGKSRIDYMEISSTPSILNSKIR